MTIRAKNPSTTEGIPARNSIAGLTHSRVRCPAYCETKTAALTASGTATSMAMTVTLMVPTSSGHTPYLGISETGCHTCSGAS